MTPDKNVNFILFCCKIYFITSVTYLSEKYHLYFFVNNTSTIYHALFLLNHTFKRNYELILFFLLTILSQSLRRILTDFFHLTTSYLSNVKTNNNTLVKFC